VQGEVNSMSVIRVIVVSLLGFLVLSGAACPNKVLREENVYRNEVKFMQKAAMDQADMLAQFVATSCECKTVDPVGTRGFVNKECLDVAKLVQVVRTRVPYHTDMMLYLAGLKEERPPETPPEVPPPEDLCP